MTDPFEPSDVSNKTEQMGVPDAPTESEILTEAKLAKAAKEASQKATIGWKTAAGIGVGSAAVAAALIFANRNRKT